MTTNKAVKKVTTANAQPSFDTSGLILAVNDSILRAVAVYSTSLMFSQPQFALQANPAGILGLADLMYRYISGEVKVEQPSDHTGQPTQDNAPTFG